VNVIADRHADAPTRNTLADSRIYHFRRITLDITNPFEYRRLSSRVAKKRETDPAARATGLAHASSQLPDKYFPLSDIPELLR
jgi:hypothetical protein